MTTRRKRILVLVLVLGLLVLGGLGYLMFSDIDNEPEGVLVAKKVTPGEEEAPPQEQQAPAGTKKETLADLFKEETNPDGTYAESYCVQVEEGVIDFFHYLDQRKYVQHLDPDTEAYNRFREIAKKVAADPPIPAGEGIDPRIIVRNIFYLFRVLDRKDLRLIKDIIENEQDAMEFNLNMFYRWLTLGRRCQDREGLRPSMKALYQYAGFFLNTIGGRAYLFRRPEGTRLLVSYYCLLIVHEADKLGRNDYGIDIVPFIGPLREEISYYPKFEFQADYIDRLNELEDYYLQKR